MSTTGPFLRIKAVLNTDSGTLCDRDCNDIISKLEAAFTVRGHQIEVQALAGTGLSQALEDAAEDDETDVILAGGGDGTISAAAAIAWKEGKGLAVLPGGTMNLFARSLRIPMDIEQAIPAIAGGLLQPVDIATANGRPFLHQYAIGLHPLMIRTRNDIGYGGKPSKIAASVRAAASITWDPPSFKTTLTLDDETVEREVSALSVAAVPFGAGHMPYADRLDPGHLGIYAARPLGSMEAMALAKDIMLGSWDGNQSVSQFRSRSVELVCSELWDDAHATIDGEVIALNEPVRIENHPGALKVMFPARA